MSRLTMMSLGALIAAKFFGVLAMVLLVACFVDRTFFVPALGLGAMWFGLLVTSVVLAVKSWRVIHVPQISRG